MPHSVFIFLPACCITFTLCLMLWAIAGASYKKSRIFTSACLIMSGVFFIDALLHGCSLLALRFGDFSMLSHALLAIPIVSIEIFFISTAGLILFHRKYHAKLLLIAGFIPSVCFLFYNLSASIWHIENYGDWPASLNAMMTDFNGLALINMSLIVFFINAIGSVIAVFYSLQKYRRQINCYFGFHDIISANILSSVAIIYFAFIIMLILHTGSYIGLQFYSDAALGHAITIIGKTCFFVYVTFVFIRYNQRYFWIEPALDAIDDIDLQVETVPATNYMADLNSSLPSDSNLLAANSPIQHAFSNELDMRLQQWRLDTNKYYLRDDINVLQVAEMLKVKPRLLSDYLNTVKGINFNQYINTLRIEEAKRMILEDKNRTFNDIAIYTGFSSAATFCKTFKRITGITPTQFKKQIS